MPDRLPLTGGSTKKVFVWIQFIPDVNMDCKSIEIWN